MALKACGHLRKLGNGVHVAGRAVFGSRDLELGFALAIRVVDVDFAPAETELFAGVAGKDCKGISGRGSVKEDGESEVGGHLRKGIAGQNGGHLRGGADQDADRFACVGGERILKRGFDVRFGLGGLKDDVAACNVSPDGLEASRFAHGFEFRHWEIARSADVDGTQESDECFHLSFLHLGGNKRSWEFEGLAMAGG
jgi:hypothetical protein